MYSAQAECEPFFSLEDARSKKEEERDRRDRNSHCIDIVGKQSTNSLQPRSVAQGRECAAGKTSGAGEISKRALAVYVPCGQDPPTLHQNLARILEIETPKSAQKTRFPTPPDGNWDLDFWLKKVNRGLSYPAEWKLKPHLGSQRPPLPRRKSELDGVLVGYCDFGGVEPACCAQSCLLTPCHCA